MIRLLYTLLFPLAVLAILPRYLARMLRRGGFRRDFGQRFGRYDAGLRERWRDGAWFWVHAVSVGELLIALKLLAELHRRHPSWRFVVSSTTSTAHGLARQRQEDWWVPIYTPVDFGPVCRRALDAVRPRAVVLTESEMWPAFIWNAAARGVPVLLVNARVSPRSARRYRRFAPLLRSVTRHLAGVGLQEPAHAGLWTHLGVTPERLHLTGSVKYDPDAAEGTPRDFRPVLGSLGFAPGDPVLLAGSTHHGEEEILARALAALREEFPAARLVIAPRHVERAAAIAADLARSGFRIARRTAAPDGPAPDILLLDTTGELRDWYACADIVFIGKSLAGRGGQNPVEAILAGRPVLFGPHMENFAALRDALLAGGGALEVQDAASLAATTADLLRDPARRDQMVHHAANALRPHQGATARTADLVGKLCHDSPARAV
jgi:3-deoxy-D-manno-octulosonic-acid transferase